MARALLISATEEVAMAIDERRTPASRPPDAADETPAPRRADWATFWEDPCFSGWRGRRRRRPADGQAWPVDAGTTSAQPNGWEDSPGDWRPAIETFHRGDEFVILADLPGTK